MPDATIGGGSMQVTTDPYKAAVEKSKSEVYLRSMIAEQTTSWFHRFGAPMVINALKEWIAYIDGQLAIIEKHGMATSEEGAT